MADIYRKFLVLSAGLKLRWQTYTGNSWFCLPGLKYGGRHIQEILGFVCRVHWLAADKTQEINNSSAAACGEVYGSQGQPGGRYGGLKWNRYGLLYGRYMADTQQIQVIYRAVTSQIQRRYAPVCTAVAKDCRYVKSLCIRSENLPERCTKIRP